MSEARAKPLVEEPQTEGERSTTATRPPPAPAPTPERDPFGSLADIGELPIGQPENAVAARLPGEERSPSQPPSSRERSRVRINACVAEEVVAPSRKDYRRE